MTDAGLVRVDAGKERMIAGSADRGDKYLEKDGKMGDRCREGDKSYRDGASDEKGEEELRRSNR